MKTSHLSVDKLSVVIDVFGFLFISTIKLALTHNFKLLFANICKIRMVQDLLARRSFALGIKLTTRTMLH